MLSNRHSPVSDSVVSNAEEVQSDDNDDSTIAQSLLIAEHDGSTEIFSGLEDTCYIWNPPEVAMRLRRVGGVVEFSEM